MEGARCAQDDVDPDWFFAENPNKARLACAECSVRCECLEYALEHDVAGLWAGSTDRDRTAIKNRRPLYA
jgi:WhiB family transcriptional regulator, redox-sensing transcriptional regulator